MASSLKTAGWWFGIGTIYGVFNIRGMGLLMLNPYEYLWNIYLWDYLCNICWKSILMGIFPWPWGYPQSSSISRWDFPWNQPSIHGGSPILGNHQFVFLFHILEIVIPTDLILNLRGVATAREIGINRLNQTWGKPSQMKNINLKIPKNIGIPSKLGNPPPTIETAQDPRNEPIMLVVYAMTGHN